MFFFLPEIAENLFNTNTNLTLVLWVLLKVYHSLSSGGRVVKCFSFILWLLDSKPASEHIYAECER